jgi:hypothetical protein
MKSTVVWIATPGFALLAMTAQGFFSSLLKRAKRRADREDKYGGPQRTSYGPPGF